MRVVLRPVVWWQGYPERVSSSALSLSHASFFQVSVTMSKTSLLTLFIACSATLALGAQDPQKAKNAKEQSIIDETRATKSDSANWRAKLLGSIEINGKTLTPLERHRTRHPGVLVFLEQFDALE